MKTRIRCSTAAAFLAILTATPSVTEGQRPTPQLTSTVRTDFRVSGTETEITTLSVERIPAGATVHILCIGKGCPFRSKSITYASAQSDVSLAEFNKSKLRPGTLITVRVTAPNTIGKVFEWQVQNGKSPTLTSNCLAPGSTKPTRC